MTSCLPERHMLVPEQNNAIDCGVFVLHFAERAHMAWSQDPLLPADEIAAALAMNSTLTSVRKRIATNLVSGKIW